jgi:carbonic anhydrase
MIDGVPGEAPQAGETMSLVDDLLRRNEIFAEHFEEGGRASEPIKRLAVLTCMDARVLAPRFLGLGIGDAHVIRNAGGRASDDAVRSLILSSRLLNTREFFVIQHTDCGLLQITNEDIQQRLEAETGADASAIDFLPIDDLERCVREDVEKLRSSPFFQDVHVAGFVYDVRTGRLHLVCE